MNQLQHHSSSTYSRFANVFKLLLLAALIFLAHPTIKAQNNCLHFDGVNDYVDLGTMSPTGNFTTGLTIMSWVKWSSFNFYAPFIVLTSGANDWSNTNEISIGGYATENGLNIRCGYISTIVQGCTSLDQWVHVAVTISSDGKLLVFVNGALATSSNDFTIPNVVRNACTLGSSNFYNKFCGSLDEVSIWSRVLSLGEIQSKMNTGLGGNEAGLCAYYRFNQGAPEGTNTSFTTLTDASINAKNGTLTNFALTGSSSNWLSSTTINKIDNNSLSFDGVDDYVNLGTVSPSGNFSNGFSYMGWVKWSSFNSYSRLFDFGTGTGINNILLENFGTSNKLVFANYLNTTPYQISTGNILTTNQWVHIAATISNTGAAKIYVNGVVAASGNISAPANIARNLCYLGKSNWPSDGYLNANMDEVSFWTKVLSVSEIQSFMNSPLVGNETGLYTYYNFNRGVGGTANTNISILQDVSASYKHGTLTNFSLSGSISNWISSVVPTSIQNNALSFDGINDNVAIPALGSGLSQFTIETWFNASSFPTSGNISGIFNTNSWNAGDIHFQFTNVGGTNKVELAVSGSTVQNLSYSFLTNKWYHLAATYNATAKRINFYVNGTLIQSTTLTTAVNANFTAGQIGAWNTSRYFNGTFDEYRIWNSERTATEISNNIYKSFNGTEAGLLAYFNFNEGNALGTNTGVTTLNNGLGLNHGTLNNFALSGTTSNWVTGIKDRPNSHVTEFAGSVVNSKMTLIWKDVTNMNCSDGYFILASRVNSFSNPNDGVELVVDNDLSDGKGVVRVPYGTQIYNSWVNEKFDSLYYFKIIPYTNSSTNILYYTSNTIPQTQITASGLFGIQGTVVLPSVTNGSIAWGDYNNDGNLDLIIAGDSATFGYSPLCRIYKGNGAGGYEPQNQINLQGINNGAIAWGDYNNDNYLDLILTGSTRYDYPPVPTTKIYKNNKNGTFTEQTQIEIAQVSRSSVAWGDYNNDGLLDIIITGMNATFDQITKIYRNNGDGSFTEQISLEGFSYGKVAWGDYDNDGFLDFIISGSFSNGETQTRLYRNINGNHFEYMESFKLPGVQGSTSVSWVDYNNDGFLDIFFSSNICKIYKNNNGTGFTESINFNLGSFEDLKSSWADYDGDGFLDLLVSYRDYGWNATTKIFKNNNALTFSEFPNQPWPHIIGQVAWIDFDNDNVMDFIISGSIKPNWYTDVAYAGLFHNNSKVAIPLPSTPTNLRVESSIETSTFRWDYPSNDKPATFAMRIGTSSGASDIVSPQALTSGKRLTPESISLIRKKSFTPQSLKAGKYYWAVQSVDQNGIASSFSSPENVLEIDTIQSTGLESYGINSTSIKIKWQRGNGNGCIIFAKPGVSDGSLPVDGQIYKQGNLFGEGSNIAGTNWYCVYNGKADSAIIMGLNPSIAYTFHVMEYFTLNNKDYYFKEKVNGNIGYFSSGAFISTNKLPYVQVKDGLASWGDYNNDGKLDILSTFVMYVDVNRYTEVYKSNGDNTFIKETGYSFMHSDRVSHQEGEWADFDNDGDLDLIIYTLSADDYSNAYGDARIFRNNYPTNSFDEVFTFNDCSGTGIVGDLNNDGYLDVVINGLNSVKVFSNNKDLTFTEKSVLTGGIRYSSVSLGDYDNDGYSDILLAGLQDSSVSKLFHNNREFNFTEKTDVSLVGVSSGVSQWCDYDNDGYLDILLAGGNTYLYHNNGNGSFTLETNTGLINFNNVTADWGDYNEDGYLDLLIAGNQTGTYGIFSKVYRNNKNRTFTEDVDIVLKPKNQGSYRWGDYDNDGDLDILMGGSGDLKIFQNTSKSIASDFSASVPPTPPTGLNASLRPGQLIVEWADGKAIDESNLSYNLMVKQVKPNNILVNSPNSDTLTGKRLFPKIGNAGMNNMAIFKNLQPGTYKIYIQAINGAFTASSWSDPLTVEVRDLQAFYSFNEVCRGNETQFTDQSTSASPMTWLWKFGDGTTSTEQSPKHIFETSGVHQVWLVVTSTEIVDGEGKFVKDSLLKSVNVKPRPKALYSAPNVCQGSETVFTNNTDMDGTTAQSWKWDYGNGESSTGIDPINKTYGIAKTYNTKLVIVANNDCADSLKVSTIVTPVPSAFIYSTLNSKFEFCNNTNESASLYVAPQDNCTYQWMNNGSGLLGETNPTLTINKNYGSNTYSIKALVKVDDSYGGCSSTTSSAIEVKVKDSPVAPTILAPLNLTICEEDTVKLSVPLTPNIKYLWSGGLNPNSSNTYNATTSGSYSVSIENSVGCTAESTNKISVIVNPSPAVPSVSYGDTEFCQGGSITFSVASINGLFYQWKRGKESITGATSSTYTTQEKGDYWLSITNSSQCGASTSPVTVTVNDLPAKPAIGEVNGITSFCPETEVTLKVQNASSSLNYQWRRSGINIEGAGNYSYAGKLSAGDYSVVASKGICSAESDIITLNTKQAPVKPTISARGPNVWILVCDNRAANIYKWYYNNQLVPTANTYQYVANKNLGDYKVEVNEGGECSTLSDIINIPTGNVVSGIDELVGEIISVSPNPSSGIFNVDLGMELMGNIDVQILDSKGALVVNQQLGNASNITINLSNYPSGIYLCRVNHKGISVAKKIVKI